MMQTLHGSIEPSKLLIFNFDANLDPDSVPPFDIDADPASQNDADPGSSGSATLL
jgi:hypothetical protein